jgi:amino acid transporter
LATSGDQAEGTLLTDSDGLRSGAVGLPAAVVQSAALIGPTGGVVIGLAFIASLSMGASPLSFVIGLAICLSIAKTIGEYAKRLPAAGSFYTYLTRTFGPKTGFVTGVLLFGAYLLLFPFQLCFFGNFVSQLVKTLGVSINWTIFALALMLLSSILAILGIRPSLRFGLITLAFEMAALTVFAVIIIAKGGAAGNTIQAFNPASAFNGTSDLLLSVVYTLFAFVGFESATTLGEEVVNPRRTIPRALLLTTLVVGLFLVFTSYASVIGFGVSRRGINQLIADPAPLNTLADRYGGGVLSVFVNLAVIVCFVALNIVTVSAITRVLYAMGRDKVLPHRLAHLNRFNAPDVAIIAVFVAVIAASVGMGVAWGALNVASWLSFFATLFFIAAYALVCFGLMRFIWTKYHDEFSWLWHGVVPVIALVGIGWVLYGNIHPFPASPLRYFIWATIAVIVAVAIMARRIEKSNPEVMQKAGQILADEG